MSHILNDLRVDYAQRQLHENEAAAVPFHQFQKWFDEALAAEPNHANAMTLATCTREGEPSARVVLLKSWDQRGFVFYTNYNSRKASELLENPRASLVFWWQGLERQVRIEGRVEKTAEEEADDYFQTRPRESQIGAWASAQSEVIPDRSTLEQRFQEIAHAYENQPIPRPRHWGGFRLAPDSIEFWQGRPNRMHDRLRYRRLASAWVVERLSP
ncbi:pyridoxamine 5'-phosphate oxidase [candidate division KSB1 bacterium]|nr:pyridoxamine 5'-phosphate oxidase [candidate division KSB1 bacterium]